MLKIGFDSSGLYDTGQEKGYGAAQNMWMKGVSQSMFCLLYTSKQYLNTIPSEQRNSASWTLSRMAGDYASRMETCLLYTSMNKLGRYDLQMFYMRNMNTYLNLERQKKA